MYIQFFSKNLGYGTVGNQSKTALISVFGAGGRIWLRGKIKKTGKGNTPKVEAGDVGGPLGEEALKKVPSGDELYLAPGWEKITLITPASKRVHGDASDEVPPHTSPDNVPVREAPSEETQVTLIPADKFKAQIDVLRQSTTIKNDKGRRRNI